MARIFLDTAPIVYLLDPNPIWQPVVARLLNEFSPETELITSVITLLECRVKPLRDKNTDVLDRIERFWQTAFARRIQIDEAVARGAADLRARYDFLRALDSLQISCALHAGCASFVTNDKKLRQISELPILCLTDQ